MALGSNHFLWISFNHIGTQTALQPIFRTADYGPCKDHELGIDFRANQVKWREGMRKLNHQYVNVTEMLKTLIFWKPYWLYKGQKVIDNIWLQKQSAQYQLRDRCANLTVIVGSKMRKEKMRVWKVVNVEVKPAEKLIPTKLKIGTKLRENIE